MPRAHRIVDDAFPEADELRGHFDSRFADPRRAEAGRFVWDYWHVPGQYTALRTPAWTYFPRALYERFHSRLVEWGRENLGCHDVSPPWLCSYVEGCGQELHGDLPHGPFAFVLSLTPWQRRRFQGGETLLLRDETLDWWNDFRSERSVEEPDVLRAIPPRFGRLLVFDPRIPHGVRRVSGVLDPRAGRLVINGWFVQPRPFVSGPLAAAAVDDLCGDIGRALAPLVDAGLKVAGLLSLRIDIRPNGEVEDLRVLADTLRTGAEQEPSRRRLVRIVRDLVRRRSFPRARRPSRLTLPIVFDRG